MITDIIKPVEPLELAIIKDVFLKYLLDYGGGTVNKIKPTIKEDRIGLGLINVCLDEMERDEAIIVHRVEGNDHIITFADRGAKILTQGGYTKIEQDKLDEAKQKTEDIRVAREKTRLEISNLKRSKWLSIIAIIFSFIALVVSIISIFRK